MPTALNRRHATMSTEAYEHMGQIVKALKAHGHYANNTSYLSELVLSQPIPANNGHTAALPKSKRQRRAKSNRRATVPAPASGD